jgi:GR25 family glycosyltransferase involved in LPS biosynthesis
MKAYVIRLEDDPKSVSAASHLVMSSSRVKNEFDITYYDAITPERVKGLMTMGRLSWKYPWEHEGKHWDMASGLMLTPYKTANPNKRIACFLSHYLLWQHCAKGKTPYLIFEHDAEFTRKLDLELLEESKYGIIALNDPRGATKKSQLYYDLVKSKEEPVVAVPKIEDLKHPQGLPGNSAYYIRPESARYLLQLVQRYGAWPNDAIMCQQLMPKQLGILRNFVTKVQGLSSTTTL